MLTKSEVRQAMPIHLKSAATDGLVDMLNNIPLDPETADTVRNNFISYTNVLKDGKYKLEDYTYATAYVTFRMMGYNNQESYARTFPDRYARLTSEGKSSKEISSYVAAYNKNKLVNAIMEQAMIPTWLLNGDVLQKAINHSVYLMENARSEMVQVQAAKALMDTLKKPESKDVNLNIGTTNDAGIEELRQMMAGMAERQQKLIESGVNTKEIAHQRLMIDVTPED